MLAWLRLKSSVREVDVEHVAPAAGRIDRWSLFTVIYAGSGREASKMRLFSGTPQMETAGFAAGWGEALQGRPGRCAKIDSSTLDTLAQLTRAESARSLAQVRIREALAYDLQYRSEIAATGTFIGIELASAAVDPLLEFVEAHGHLDDWPKHKTRILLRFPLKQPFAFPEPRGSENPYNGDGIDLPLHPIATFHADWLEVGVFSRAEAPRVDWDTQPLIGLVTSPAILRLSARRGTQRIER